jgi:cytoskeletal protein RodZ
MIIDDNEWVFSVDNTLKILLGVLGFAGFLTFVATALDLPSTTETPPVTAAVNQPVTPAPEADSTPGTDAENSDSQEPIEVEDDVTKEEIDSYSEPSIDLPGYEDQNDEQTTSLNENQPIVSPDSNEGPAPPPPPGAR